MATLPDIPESWFKLINLLWMIALSILGALGYQKISQVETNQVVTHQKQDVTNDKINEVEVKQDKMDRVTTKTAAKVGAVNGDK